MWTGTVNGRCALAVPSREKDAKGCEHLTLTLEGPNDLGCPENREWSVLESDH
jgi:hypothetical protein